MEFVNPSRLKFSPDFQNTEGVVYKSSCSVVNAVMEYINFCSSGSKLESVTKNHTPSH